MARARSVTELIEGHSIQTETERLAESRRVVLTATRARTVTRMLKGQMSLSDDSSGLATKAINSGADVVQSSPRIQVVVVFRRTGR